MAEDDSEQRQLLEEAVLVSNLGSKTWCGQTYKNIFTGETLVKVLMKDALKYPDRETAIQDAQGLLHSRAIMSITGRGAFDDGDRLYYINQDAKKGTGKSLGKSKVTMDKKTKDNKQEVNKPGSHHTTTPSLLVKEQPTLSSGITPSRELQRLLAKDTSQEHVRPAVPRVSNMTSDVRTVKTGHQGLTTDLKDKPLEGNQDDRLAEKIKGASSRISSDKASGKHSSLSNEGVAKTKTAAGVSVTILDEDRDGKTKGKTSSSVSVNVLDTVEDVKKVSSSIGNGSQCLLNVNERDATKSGGNFGGSVTSLNHKQKLEKTLSPALSALIEKDSRNCQVPGKPGERGSTAKNKNHVDSKTKEHSEVSNGPVEVNGETDELSNSWEAFELKLQNKIKKMSPRKSPGNDAVSSNDEHTRGERENAAVIARARAKHLGSASDENDETLTFSLESQKNSLAKDPSLDQGSSDARTKDNVTEQDRLMLEGFVVLNSVSSRKNSFLSAEEANKRESKIERLPSVTLNDDSEKIVIEGSGKLGHPRNEASIGRTDPNRSRGSSFSGDARTVVIEDEISGKSPSSVSSLGTGKVEERPSRSSSFSSRSEEHLGVSISEDLSTASGSKHPVNKKTSQTGSTGSQDDAVMVKGQLLPKSLAALLAKDECGAKKTETDGEVNIFKYKLKELKRNEGRTRSVSFKDEIESQQKIKRDALEQQRAEGDSLGHRGQHEEDPSPKLGDLSRTQSGEKITSTQAKPMASHVIADVSSSIILVDNKGSDRNKGITKAVDDNNNILESHKGTIGHEAGSTEGNTGPVRALSPPSSATSSVSGNQKSHAQSGSLSLSHTSLPLDLSPDSSTPAISTVATRPTSLTILSSVASTSSSPSLGNASPAQLRHELERHKQEYEEKQQVYESKIMELQLQLDYLRRHRSGQINDHDISLESSASMSDLTSLFSASVVSPGNSSLTSPSLTPRGSVAGESVILTPRSPPPPPPAPPSVPPIGTPTGSNVKPTKPVINPRIEMKPLFWNRIVAPQDAEKDTKSVWKSIKEPMIDTNEFERLFSKKGGDRKLKRTKSLRDDKHFTRINGKKVVKLLEANRSRAIGIKMSSLNCELKDIRNAVYNMDTGVVDMESLQFIYDIFPKENEIQLIEDHVEKHPSVLLDKPEEFMFQLTKMKHFKERLECWLFEEKFSEVIFGIDRSLSCVTESCSTIMSNAEITTILSLILAYGNYMNGNTVRGQADGFHLEVLTKLRDVKAMDSDMNLLQYIIKQYIKQHERSSDKTKGSEYRLPSSVSLSNAAQVSFETLKKELLKVSSLLRETEHQVKIIVDECSPDQRNPFEEKMRKFQSNAKHKIAEANLKMDKAQKSFGDATEYFQWMSNEKKKSPQEFFSLWAKFVEEIKNCIKAEKQHQQVAKKNFSKVEHLNQIREAATKFRKRRQSVDDII